MAAIHARLPIARPTLPFARRPLTPASSGGPSGALAGLAHRQAQQATQIAAFAKAGGLAQGPRGFAYGRYGNDGGLGYGGFGYDGGIDDAGLGLPSPQGAVYGVGPMDTAHEPSFIPTPRPCARPRFISVLGRGVRHRVTTRVVYGAPSPCGF